MNEILCALDEGLSCPFIDDCRDCPFNVGKRDPYEIYKYLHYMR